MDRVVGSRNLTNKLWNAGKFLQMALAQASASDLAALAAADFSRPDALAALPLTERWMLSSLHQVPLLRPPPPGLQTSSLWVYGRYCVLQLQHKGSTQHDTRFYNSSSQAVCTSFVQRAAHGTAVGQCKQRAQALWHCNTACQSGRVKDLPA